MVLGFSLRSFVADADNYAIKMVDNLLDVLTNGEHSKTLKHLQSVSWILYQTYLPVVTLNNRVLSIMEKILSWKIGKTNIVMENSWNFSTAYHKKSTAVIWL